MSICIYIPVYNEEKTIGKVIADVKQALKGQDFKIIVVDDGSADGTVEEARKAGAEVFSHPHCYGLAEVFRTEMEKALETDAKYIGMIGSRRKTRTILKRLHERGIPAATLNRVYSPIGISIGAVTPEEIALSIVCELTKIRRLGHTPEIGHMTESFSKWSRGKNL